MEVVVDSDRKVDYTWTTISRRDRKYVKYLSCRDIGIFRVESRNKVNRIFFLVVQLINYLYIDCNLLTQWWRQSAFRSQQYLI